MSDFINNPNPKITEAATIVKQVECYHFLSWFSMYMAKMTFNESRKQRKDKKEYALELLDKNNLSFALQLMGDFKPRENTFEELIEFAKIHYEND